MVWVNRVGMLFEFLSFWFAAPEIVTEIKGDGGEWLGALERRLEQGIEYVPAGTFFVGLALADSVIITFIGWLLFKFSGLWWWENDTIFLVLFCFVSRLLLWLYYS
jgi:hypothetical protein